MALPQKELFKLESTRGDMVIPVDYNDAGAVDPGQDVLFWDQGSVDRFLAQNGATNIKHLTAAWGALPKKVNHTVTFQLAAGVHRPRDPEPEDPYGGYLAFPFFNRDVGSGEIILQGALPSTYDPVDPSLDGLAITGKAGSGNPNLTFAGTPFNGFDLRGCYVVLSTGQVTIVHDHDDNTLYTIDDYSPNPTGGTVTVARPSTVLRNSFNDATPARIVGVVFFEGPGVFHAKNLLLQGLSASSGATCISVTDSNASLYDCMCDYAQEQVLFGRTPDGRPIQGSGKTTRMILVRCSMKSVGHGLNEPYMIWSGYMFMMQSMAYNYGQPVAATQGGELQMRNTVLDGPSDFVLLIEALSKFGFNGTHYYNGSLQNLFRNAPNGVRLMDGSTQYSSAYSTLTFRNIVGSCFEMGSGVRLVDQAAGYENTGDGFFDGGGNSGLGIEIVGPGCIVKITGATDVGGAAGDVQLFGGDVRSWSDIETNGPYTDLGLCVVSKEP